jgi:multiple sugar transport system substrate-binding protein
MVQTLADLFNVSKLSPPYSKVQGIQNTGAEPFQFGDIAMGITGGWGFRSFKDVKFHWAAAAIPWSAANTDVLFTDPYMVFKGTKHPKEAMQFIKYLTNSDSMASYIKNVGFTPSNPDFLGTWYSQYAKITGMSANDLTTLVAGARKYGKESPNHLIVNFSAIHNYMKPNCIEPAFFGHRTAAAALSACVAPINAILQQNTGQ